MKDPRPKLLVAAALIFVVGAGYIVYSGRPVVTNKTTNSATNASGDGTVGTYSMADVASHDSVTSCWSAINGGVYDLTGWITRHPGGAQRIIALCGTDGSDAFNGQHGGQRRPQAALALLKIGTLK